MLAGLLSVVGCTSRVQLAWYLDMKALESSYRQAVKDASEVTEEKVYDGLIAVTSPGDDPRMEWLRVDTADLVLVASMMDTKDWASWQETDTFRTSKEDLLWVTIPYEWEEALQACADMDSVASRMRMLQLLGLPPNCTYDAVTLFYTERSRLYRPSKDPEPDDRVASLEYPAGVPIHYKEWFGQNAEFSYYSDTPFPWTQLGYTYDWNPETSRVGLSEFVVHARSLVKVKERMGCWTFARRMSGRPGNEVVNYINNE